MIRKLLWLAGTLVLWFQYTGVAMANPLTEQQVQNYLNSMPQAHALAEKHDDGKRKKIDTAQPLSSAIQLMNGQGSAYEDMGKLAAEHGFSSAEEWADVGDRVMNGYIVLSTTLSAEQVEQGYQQGVSNIKKDPKLTDAQKQKILQNMEKSHARNQNRRINAQPDLPALTHYKATLENIYK